MAHSGLGVATQLLLSFVNPRERMVGEFPITWVSHSAHPRQEVGEPLGCIFLVCDLQTRPSLLCTGLIQLLSLPKIGRAHV